MYEKLEMLLKNVSDSYDDFVRGGVTVCKRYPDITEKMISYLENNPKATTSDVIEYECDLRGIKKVYPPIEQGA